MSVAEQGLQGGVVTSQFGVEDAFSELRPGLVRAATTSMRMAALSTTFEPALLKRVKNFLFRDCTRRPTGDPSGPTVREEVVRPSGPSREGEHSLLATLNIQRTGGLAARPGSCSIVSG